MKRWLSENAAFKPRDKLDPYTGWTETLKSLNCDDLEREPSILSWAVENMHIEFVKDLLAFDGLRVDGFFESAEPTYHGFKPLHFAAANGDTEMIRLLVSSGAHVGTTAHGSSKYFGRPDAICIAAESPGSLDTIKTLVELGATIKSATRGNDMVQANYCKRDVRGGEATADASGSKKWSVGSN